MSPFDTSETRGPGEHEPMPRVFLTAFDSYDDWQENASWLALVAFTKDVTAGAQITTRLYPVDFDQVRQRVREDLAEDADYVVHRGQAPGAPGVCLEAIGVNVGGNSRQRPEEYQPLVDDGPVAYRSALPLADWAEKLRGAGIPASVSYHAGTYLCNATLYLTHYWIDKLGLKSQAAFIHLPLAPGQAARAAKDVASLPSTLAAQAVRLIVTSLVTREPLPGPKLA